MQNCTSLVYFILARLFARHLKLSALLDIRGILPYVLLCQNH